MPRRLTAVLLTLAAATGLTACGGSDVVGDVVPKETPELVPPGEGSGTLPAVASGDDATTDTTSTTDTTDTTATDGSAAAPTTDGSAGTAAPAAPAATPAPAQSGGTAAPQTGGTGTGGGTDGAAEAGGFSDFCTQNPGACDN